MTLYGANSQKVSFFHCAVFVYEGLVAALCCVNKFADYL